MATFLTWCFLGALSFLVCGLYADAAYRPVIPVSYSFTETGPSETANTLVGCAFNSVAITVLNIDFTVHHTACSVSPTVVLDDCGTSAGSCSGTTLSNGAVVAASHYICAVWSAGTCTVYGWTYNLAGSVNP